MRKNFKFMCLIFLLLALGCNKDSKKKKNAYNNFLKSAWSLIENVDKNFKSFFSEVETLDDDSGTKEELEKGEKVVQKFLTKIEKDKSKIEKIKMEDAELEEFRTALLGTVILKIESINSVLKTLKEKKKPNYGKVQEIFGTKRKKKLRKLLEVRKKFLKKYNLTLK